MCTPWPRDRLTPQGKMALRAAALIAALIAAVVVLLLCQGCSKASAPRPSAAPPPSETTEAPQAEGRPKYSAPSPGEDAAPPEVHAYRVLTENDYHLMRVFYATDRAPGDAPRSGRLFLPALIALGASVVMAVWAVRVSRRPFRVTFIALACAALGAGVYYTHSAVIEVQQLRRAAAWGDRTYGQQRHLAAGRPVLELGTCEVSIPPDHRVGFVEAPSVLRLEFREDPKRHVVLHRIHRLPDEEFFRELKADVEASFNSEALVFVHGYNIGFEDAVKRTAQMAYDLRFDGAAICYSWPSSGGLAQYTVDEANISWTVLQLEDFLARIAQQTQVKHLHLIAHSMGNRALTQALEHMAMHDPPPAKFGQVILAAPDVDADEFRNRYAPVLTRLAEHVTLYASSSDQALKASTRVHGSTRAGLSGEHMVICDGLDSVDVSPIDTSLIGHSYYGDNPLMIRDLEAVIAFSLPPENRGWLRRMMRPPALPYWKFRRDVPSEELGDDWSEPLAPGEL